MGRYKSTRLFMWLLSFVVIYELSALLLVGDGIEQMVVLCHGSCFEYSLTINVVSACTFCCSDVTNIINRLLIYMDLLSINKSDLRYAQILCAFISVLCASSIRYIKMFFDVLKARVITIMRMLTFHKDNCWNGIDVTYLKNLTVSTQRIQAFFV